MNIENIFYDLISESKDGSVFIDGDDFPIGFNTVIYDSDEEKRFDSGLAFPTLTIKNKEEFFKLLGNHINLELQKNRKTSTYLHDKELNHIKTLMAYLFINATPKDFSNPEILLRKNIDFLCDKTFSNYNDGEIISLDDVFEGSSLKIKNTNQSIFMETPYRIDFSIIDEDDTYNLPSISYGISNGKCYIYSIINPKKTAIGNTKLGKKISRLLYKINEDVKCAETKEFIDYLDGMDDYYPENISDVSVSFVFSLSIFMMLLENKKIEIVKATPYLPLRYLSRQMVADSLTSDDKKEEFSNRNDTIQRNITEKFLRTFMRVKHHMGNMDILSYPYETDEYLTFKLSRNKDINGKIFESLASDLNKETGKQL